MACYERIPRSSKKNVEQNHAKAAVLAEKANSYLESLKEMAENASSTALPDADDMAKLSRYETTIHRALIRDLHELQRLQGQRNGEPVAAPIAIDVTTDS